MVCLAGCSRLLLLMPVQMVSATARSTWLWRQRYLPSPKAFEQQLRMCSRDPLFWQSWQAGESTRPQVNRLAGLGRTSYTDWTKNLKWCYSIFQSSAQVILRSAECSHLVQAPCLASARSTASWARHFRPVLTSTPAEETLVSAESL